MGDWNQTQDYNRVTITPYSPESCAAEIAPTGTAAAVWPAANLALYVPFVVYQPLTVVKISFGVGTASGNCDVGIYDAFGNRLVSQGSTAVAGSSAIQTIDITDTLLKPGNYYMAICVDNGTATIFRNNPSLQLCGAAGLLQQAVGAVTLPDPATFAATAQAYIPIMSLSARTSI